MSVVEAVERDIAALPDELGKSGFAALALVLARTLDRPGVTPSEIASCGRALQVALDRLRELAPPEEAKDGIDRIAERRENRRAGGAAPSDLPRS